MSRMETFICCFWNDYIVFSIWNNNTLCSDLNNTMFSFWNDNIMFSGLNKSMCSI